MKKMISMALALATAASLLAGCGAKDAGTGGSGKTAEASDEITLAFVGPQTGDNAEYGKSMKVAAQIAIDQWNEKGGVAGKKIKLIDYDDANSSEQAASIAEKIVGDDSVSTVLGHFSSGVAMTAGEVFQESPWLTALPPIWITLKPATVFSGIMPFTPRMPTPCYRLLSI